MNGKLLAIALIAAASPGCGGSEDQDPLGPTGAGPAIEDPGPLHVHGLGINPKDDALFIATHTGLFRAAEGEPTAKRVADRYQDTMGFTVVGPDRFLGSGHPDGRENLPPFLGLIQSRDGGQTWQEVSLMGKSDFHVLEASGSHVYGFGSNYDTRRPEFLVSDDGGRTWKKRSPPGGIVSMAISPEDPLRLAAAIEGGPGEDGLYASEDAGAGWRRLTRRTGLLGWTASEQLYLVDARGIVSQSRDGGTSWEKIGEIGGRPAAFETAGGDLYVALHDGIVKRSTDGGRTWRVRSRPQPTVTR